MGPPLEGRTAAPPLSAAAAEPMTRRPPASYRGGEPRRVRRVPLLSQTPNSGPSCPGEDGEAAREGRAIGWPSCIAARRPGLGLPAACWLLLIVCPPSTGIRLPGY